jgi:hypothetical protein
MHNSSYKTDSIYINSGNLSVSAVTGIHPIYLSFFLKIPFTYSSYLFFNLLYDILPSTEYIMCHLMGLLITIYSATCLT